MYKSYVITLARSGTGDHRYHAEIRLARTLAQSKNFGWNLEIFDAINGYLIDDSIWHYLNLSIPSQSDSGNKFGDKPGALGCFISHYMLWKKCVDLNQPIIILEDDADLLGPVPEINSVSDLVKLHQPRNKKEHPVVGRWSPGAFGYWVTPLGASKIIEFVKNNGPKYNDKLIGSNILSWKYIDTPIVSLRKNQGSSTNPTKYPYKN